MSGSTLPEEKTDGHQEVESHPHAAQPSVATAIALVATCTTTMIINVCGAVIISWNAVDQLTCRMMLTDGQRDSCVDRVTDDRA